jgi:tape measure domain-containing protein
MSETVVYTLTLKDLLTGKIQVADKEVSKFETKMRSAQTTASNLGSAIGIAFGTAGIIAFGKSVFDVTREVGSLKIGLDMISGGQGQETFEYLTEFSNKLGLNLQSAAQGYKTIGAAAKGTELEGQSVRTIFESMSEASAVFGLSAEQTEGALMAVSQMISKGKVSAEELRGQLGERMPGAFQVAARAMGVTTQKLDDMLVKGELIATDFLPKFANQLRTEVSGGLPAAMTSLNAEFARSQNQIFMLQEKIGRDLTPAFAAILSGVSSFIDVMRSAWDWTVRNADAIKAVAIGLGVVAGAYAIYRASLLAGVAIQGIQTAVTYVQIAAMYTLGTAYGTASIFTKLMAAAQYALNAAMTANPIGIVIVALGALTAGVVYAYNQFGTFRAVLWGVWGVIKAWAALVVDAFEGVWKVIKGVFTLDGAMVIEGFKQSADVMVNAGRKLADGFKTGYDEGMKDFASDQAKKTVAAPKNVAGPTAGGTKTTPAIAPVKAETKGAQAAKAVTINVTIGSLIKDFKIQTTNVTEGAAKVREMVAQALVSATNDSQLIAGQ